MVFHDVILIASRGDWRVWFELTSWSLPSCTVLSRAITRYKAVLATTCIVDEFWLVM